MGQVEPHPAGSVKYGGFWQVVRCILLIDWFCFCCFSIHAFQFVGAPLYFYNQDLYYAFMAYTKQMFGLTVTTMTEWWCPTLMRVSGDKSVRGQIKRDANGFIHLDFPDRMVMIANHQLYSDWLYLWWVTYTNHMHGHIFIILKESLKYVPVLGPGMMFYGFIFLARKWASDQARFAHRLNKLKTIHKGPMSGEKGRLDPMSLLIFPEGTNLCPSGRAASKRWAEKQGIPDMKNQLLPRSTGLLFCLQQLKGTVDYVYDCTLAYEGVARGRLPEEFFTLRTTFLAGRPPKSVNMHWRRFAVNDIPLGDAREFELWLRQRWQEKDELLDYYLENGRFPADDGTEIRDGVTVSGAGFVECEVRMRYWWEFVQIFAGVGSILLLCNIFFKLYRIVSVVLGI